MVPVKGKTYSFLGLWALLSIIPACSDSCGTTHGNPARQASVAASPTWAAAYGPPQLLDTEAWFQQRKSDSALPSGALVDALLLCEITTTGQWDPNSDPDLQVGIQFGSEQEIKIQGPNDRSQVYVSTALTRLKAGTKVHLRVWDYDSYSVHEFIGQGETVYQNKFPLIFHDKHMKASCVLVPANDVDIHLQSSLQAFEPLLKQMEEHSHFHVLATDCGFPHDEVGKTKRQLLDIAAHRGWNIPPLRTKLAAFESWEHNWYIKTTRAVQHYWQQSAKREFTLQGIQFSFLSQECKHGACVVQVRLKNTTPQAQSVQGHWVSTTGRWLPALASPVASALAQPVARIDLPAKANWQVTFSLETQQEPKEPLRLIHLLVGPTLNAPSSGILRVD
jgi:hypothetical protein